LLSGAIGAFRFGRFVLASPPSWFDKLTMRAGLWLDQRQLPSDLILSLSKDEVGGARTGADREPDDDQG
jgi:hypothetical protein